MISKPIVPLADVAKLVDALDLGSSAVRHGGSSPSIRSNTEPSITILSDDRKEIEGF